MDTPDPPIYLLRLLRADHRLFMTWKNMVPTLRLGSSSLAATMTIWSIFPGLNRAPSNSDQSRV